MAEVAWEKLDRLRFEKIVESLYRKRYLGPGTFAVNGRGGDDGIDIHIETGEPRALTIAQLKFFPEGFSGGFAKSRREQIRRSYATAAKHDPKEWQLVVPNTLTMPERLFVMGLGGRKRGGPIIVIVDRTDLDVLASEHPELVTYFEKDELLEAAKVYGQETALLTASDHVADRVSALGAVVDTLDPDWTWDFERRGGRTIRTLRAQHDQAHLTSPISLKVEMAVSDEGVRARMDRLFKFGAAGSVTLGPDEVHRFTVDGPPAFAKSETGVELEFVIESDGDAVPGEVTVVGDDGESTYPAMVTHQGASVGGASVTYDFFGGVLQMEFLLPRNTSESIQTNLSVDLTHAVASTALQVLDLVDELENPKVLRLMVDSQPLAGLENTDRESTRTGTDFDVVVTHLRGLAEDLDIIGRSTRQYFTMPSSISELDRIRVRCARLLLEGHCVVLPDEHAIPFKLNGTTGPGMDVLLAGEPRWLRITQGSFVIEIFGRRVKLGPTTLLAPDAAAMNGAEAQAAFQDGDAKGFDLDMRIPDDRDMWAILEKHQPTEQTATIQPVPWGLPGVGERPDALSAMTVTRGF